MSVIGIALRGFGKALKKDVKDKTIKSVKPTSKTTEYKYKNLPKRAKAIYQAEILKGGKK